jgi:hypothetical protein
VKVLVRGGSEENTRQGKGEEKARRRQRKCEENARK